MSNANLKRSGPIAPGVAFVTGGARGLGNAIAVSFAKEGALGVVIVDIDPETLEEGKKIVESYGTKCLAIQADITKEADVENAVAKAVDAFGRIDYAANFAGIAGELAPIVDLTLEGYEKGLAVNSTGVFLCNKYQIRQMMTQEPLPFEEGRISQRGAIVNAASLNSHFTLAGAAPYTTSKHAVVGITKTAALEARAHQIRVNAISPGFLLTDLTRPLAKSEGGVLAGMWDAFEERQGRSAGAEEVGDVAVLITSPRMGLVNGVNLFVDGGFSINAA